MGRHTPLEQGGRVFKRFQYRTTFPVRAYLSECLRLGSKNAYLLQVDDEKFLLGGNQFGNLAVRSRRDEACASRVSRGYVFSARPVAHGL